MKPDKRDLASTHERRRLRGDLIETFKIAGKERIDFFKKFFELAYATSWLRGHWRFGLVVTRWLRST